MVVQRFEFKGDEDNSLVLEQATVLRIERGAVNVERPDAEEVTLLDWEEAGIRIPWCKHMTPAEAIRAWANVQPPSCADGL